MLRSKIHILAGLLFMTACGCSSKDVRTFNIDGHLFSVPKKYLIKGEIPWLPASQNEGLMFVINPEAPLPEQNSVLVQSKSVTCPNDSSLNSSPLASACRAARITNKIATGDDVQLEKVFSNGDDTPWDGKDTPWWNYRVKNPNAVGHGDVVAACSAVGENGGICHAYGTYNDLVYSVGLEDSQIRHLSNIRRSVQKLLLSWEKPAH